MRVSVSRVTWHRRVIKVMFTGAYRPATCESEVCPVFREVIPRIARFRNLIIRRPSARRERRITSNKRTLASSGLIQRLHHSTNDHCVSGAEHEIREVGVSSSRVNQSVTGITRNDIRCMIGVITNVRRP